MFYSWCVLHPFYLFLSNPNPNPTSISCVYQSPKTIHLNFTCLIYFLRLLIAQEAMDGQAYASGGSEVVFDGLGEASSVEVTMHSDLDDVDFTDAIVEFT